MTLLEQLKIDNLAARKAKESGKAALLTTLVSEIDMVGKNDGNRVSSDEEAKVVIRKFIKNACEIISLSKGVESEAVLKARDEINLLYAYLPVNLTVAQLREVIVEIVAAGANNIGQIMAKLKADYEGRYDGKAASMLAKELLK